MEEPDGYCVFCVYVCVMCMRLRVYIYMRVVCVCVVGAYCTVCSSAMRCLLFYESSVFLEMYGENNVPAEGIFPNLGF